MTSPCPSARAPTLPAAAPDPEGELPPEPMRTPAVTITASTASTTAVRTMRRRRSRVTCSRRTAAARAVRFVSRCFFDITASRGNGVEQVVQGQRGARPPDQEQRQHEETHVAGDLPG